MSILEEVREIESAEELFELFALPFDPALLAPVRLHVLNRFGQYREQIDRCHGDAAEEQTVGWYRDALARAYEDFQAGLRDADRRSLIKGEKTCSCQGGCQEIQQQPIPSGECGGGFTPFHTGS